MMEVLTNAMVVIILQYINVSKQHVGYLKLAELYINYISIKKKVPSEKYLKQSVFKYSPKGISWPKA